MELTEYFRGHLQARRQEPGDDLISYMLTAKYPDGQPFKENHILGSLRLLLVAGIDTTWSGIGASLWHLAKTPADRRRLAEEPALVPSAIEEFLRAYSPVTMARLIAKETTLNGCTFREGEMVMLSFPAANRDPAMFPYADQVIIDRKENRHAAFGLGIHRCVGSNLARMEMTVAVEEFLKRIPDFALAGEAYVVHRLRARPPPGAGYLCALVRDAGAHRMECELRSGNTPIEHCILPSGPAIFRALPRGPGQ